MKTTKQSIDRISRVIKTQLKIYQKTVRGHQWPYLEQTIFSLLKDPSVFVSQVARSLGGDLMTVEKRLLRIFHSPKMVWQKMIQAHLRRLQGYVRKISFDKLLIYADLSDLAKPLAKKMPDLDRVRDGSQSTKKKAKTQPGFWLNEIYVQFPNKKIFPAIFYPFSTLEKGFRSITDLVLEHMGLVFTALAGLGLRVSDRGYDNLKFFCAFWLTTGNSSSASNSMSMSPEKCSITTAVSAPSTALPTT